MAHTTPQFNIKTGSDSQMFFSREWTKEDTDKGKIVDSVTQDQDKFEYPQLTRRTGHSIKGTTESIESNELRKGRTKSAPRKGNSSSEGSLDIELSPETYDDIFEAALRNKWAPFSSDNNRPVINPDNIICSNLEIVTHTLDTKGNSSTEQSYAAVKLLGTEDTAIFKLDSANKIANYEVSELTCGTEDIKYSAITQYGGITGEDLYQEFQHLAVNTMDLSVSPGQIVTGSFGFMGSNNPKLLPEGGEYKKIMPQPASGSTLPSNCYYKVGEYPNETYTSTSGTADSKQEYYLKEDNGFVKELNGRFKSTMNTSQISSWVRNLSNKLATTTDQFTAREGFLYVNGRRVQYGSNLTMNLNNGLKQLFAVFESGSISTAPLSLDITGTLDAYLISNYAEFLYNYGINDEDVELLFCFQDKEDDPDYMYVFQIFKAKFDTDISQGTEELTVSLPFTSFGERAMRIFRIRKKVGAVKDILYTPTTGKITVAFNDDFGNDPAVSSSTLKVTAIIDGEAKEVTLGTYSSSTKTIVCEVDPIASVGNHRATIKAVYNDLKPTSKTYDIEIPFGDVSINITNENNATMTINWAKDIPADESKAKGNTVITVDHGTVGTMSYNKPAGTVSITGMGLSSGDTVTYTVTYNGYTITGTAKYTTD